MKKEIKYKSKENITDIHAYIWIPSVPIKGIVQISHGMVENMNKYEELATYLNNRGYLVCGEDHIGHGKSSIDKEHYGYIAKEKPQDVILEDAYELTKLVKKEYPKIPYFFLGFSLGAIIGRNYITRYGNELDGAIFIGAPKISTSKLNLGILIAHFEQFAFGGPLAYSKLLDNMCTGKNTRYFESKDNPLCWISKDGQKLKDTYSDPTTKFKFKNNGYLTLFRLLKLNNKKKFMKQIPKELPIYLMSGKSDPVTDMGASIQKIEKIYKKLGIQNVKTRLYNDARHDLIIEVEREVVFHDIITYIDSLNKSENEIKTIKTAKVIKTAKANLDSIE